MILESGDTILLGLAENNRTDILVNLLSNGESNLSYLSGMLISSPNPKLQYRIFKNEMPIPLRILLQRK